MNAEVQRHFEQAAECVEDARVLLDNNLSLGGQHLTKVRGKR